MINEEFFEFLEYRISATLQASQEEQIKGFWCDGILKPGNENAYSKKNITANRQIITTAFFGKTGQEKYQLIINFGDKSLSRYVRNLSLTECIPSINSKDWLEIDIDQKIMIIELD